MAPPPRLAVHFSQLAIITSLVSLAIEYTERDGQRRPKPAADRNGQPAAKNGRNDTAGTSTRASALSAMTAFDEPHLFPLTGETRMKNFLTVVVLAAPLVGDTAVVGVLGGLRRSNAGSAVARGESKSVAGCWGAGWNSRMVAVRRFVLGTSQEGQACDMSGGQRFRVCSVWNPV